ncbi:MAG: ABC transporter permease [Firmicutes bacterium]|nr:ABC transporter permease [Bacillota bacterium]
MKRYLINRILRGLVAIVCVVAIIMILIYSLLDRNLVFAVDPLYTKQSGNQKKAYTYRRWEEYGYLDYVPYADYMLELRQNGEITEEVRGEAVKFGKTPAQDSPLVQQYVKQFTEYYESKGYTVLRLNAAMETATKYLQGGQEQLFAYKDRTLLQRLGSYLGSVITIDNIHKVKDDIGERGLTFTLHDPAYGGQKFSPAIMGNGTTHKYLLYFNSKFPYLHQNLITINLGTSYSVNRGIDVFTTMTQTQGSYVLQETYYPTGLKEMSADDLHTATYVQGSLASNAMLQSRFTDDYTSTITTKSGSSKMGYSFSLGIISSLLAYLIGIPIGIYTARHKDRLADKIGTIYVIFIIAVPSLAYIFLFKAIGGKLFGLPTVFDVQQPTWLMYILPIVSLALPAIAGLMKWLRRFMIDQMNSDYVKFARSGGLSEPEIFSKHILKNAIIPIVHGIPGTILGAMVGAIITERVYSVPGTGNMLTTAINSYDNSVIVGVAMFYAVLSVTSLILGDLLMSMVDPRISFTTRAR